MEPIESSGNEGFAWHTTAFPIETRARLRLAAASAATVLFWCACCALVPAERAYAYVDPSVMTYTIQAVAGVAVALSAVAGVAFRRTRRKIYQVFNIDENAHKITEDAVVRIDPGAPDGPQRIAEARTRAVAWSERCRQLEDRNRQRKLGYGSRFAFSLVMTVFMAFIVFIAPAIEIVGSNADSLVFTLGAIGWIPVAFGLAFAAIAAALLALVRGKAFYIVLLVLFCLTVGAYCQSLFMNQGMMPADGGFIGWTEPYFVSRMVGSGIVWLLILAVPLVLSRRHRHLWLKATTVAACLIMAVQLVGVGSVVWEARGQAAEEAGKPYVTQGGLLSLAPQNNVVVFVLDTYDTEIMDEILAEDPDYLESFRGFTYFPDSTGTMIPTSNAVPYMLTGQKPQPGQSIGEYRRTRYAEGRLLPTLHEKGYTLGIYTDALMMDYRNPAERRLTEDTLNIHPIDHAPIDVWQTFLACSQCALYREAPWVAKPLFWYYTSDLNNRMIAGGLMDGDLNDMLYELDDGALLQLIRERRLSIDEPDAAGAFRFIHLFGPHFPFSLDEDGQFIGTNRSNQMAQAKGSMRVVEAYLDQMRELGLYDGATVIVTADHGIWDLTHDPVDRATSPLMLAKPAFQPGDPAADAPAAVSPMPVDHDDIIPTVLAAIGEDPEPFGTSLFDQDDPERVRYFDALTNAGGQGQRFVEYAVRGDARQLESWEKTGITWQDE